MTEDQKTIMQIIMGLIALNIFYKAFGVMGLVLAILLYCLLKKGQ